MSFEEILGLGSAPFFSIDSIVENDGEVINLRSKKILQEKRGSNDGTRRNKSSRSQKAKVSYFYINRNRLKGFDLIGRSRGLQFLSIIILIYLNNRLIVLREILTHIIFHYFIISAIPQRNLFYSCLLITFK